MKCFKNNKGPWDEQLNSHLNPLTTSVWPHINMQNNNGRFLLPSYHLNEIHACFIWHFNNVDSYPFFIMCYTYVLFRHRSIGHQWLLCTGIRAGNNRWGSTADGNTKCMFVLTSISIWVTSFIFWITVLAGKRVCLHRQWMPAGYKVLSVIARY